jgi:hypothetical protein
MNFDADHFELVGLRSDFNESEIFEFYSNTIKHCDDGFENYNFNLENHKIKEYLKDEK